MKYQTIIEIVFWTLLAIGLIASYRAADKHIDEPASVPEELVRGTALP